MDSKEIEMRFKKDKLIADIKKLRPCNLAHNNGVFDNLGRP